jgi:uncharacterized protein YceH (UPF0502 family)
MSDQGPSTAPVPAKWTPIGRVERRVLGVLVEKAKTTPDAYPLTLNGLTTGCNQKSNRDPQMNLEPNQVETALEELRHMSAVIEVSGGGRVPKYRHLVYEWLGVDKPEAAVMTELLLRGAQTVGELRGRAARMEPIADVAALQPVLQSLIHKKLVISLTPPGRGQVVSHALYLPEEMEKVRAAAGPLSGAVGGTPDDVTTRSTHSAEKPSSAVAASAHTIEPSRVDAPAPTAPAASPHRTTPPSAASRESQESHEIQGLQQLRREVEELRSELARLKRDVQDIWANLS